MFELKEDKSCSKCYKDNKEVTDYDTTDEEYIFKDEFISNKILSNICQRKRIYVIKESMLEEKHRMHELQSNYINSLKDRIACLQKDVVGLWCSG